jgi:hypothetical protein
MPAEILGCLNWQRVFPIRLEGIMPLDNARRDVRADPTWALFRHARLGDKLASAVVLSMLAGLAALAIALVVGSFPAVPGP